MGLEKKCSAHNHLACVTLSEYFNGQILKINFQFQMGGGSVDRKHAMTMSRASSSGGLKESKSVK